MLTDTALRNLKPGAAPYELADRDGMYVTVSTAGTIAFRYDYRLKQGQHWAGLQSLVMVESTREIIAGTDIRTCKTERRYYISSLPAKAALLGNTVRAHWGIENSMHWVLDVAFREDDCRIRCGDAAQNFAILRRIALNTLKLDTKTKLGIANKRLKAGWDVAYLAKLLGL